jgi:hypothetical protein
MASVMASVMVRRAGTSVAHTFCTAYHSASLERTPSGMIMNARTVVLAVSVGILTACSPRQVEVRTAPAQATQVSVQVNNNLNQAVNVYATLNGTDTFLRQVAANASVTVPVQGFATGSTVSLKAVTVDGVHNYSRDNVTLNGTFVFTLP